MSIISCIVSCIMVMNHVTIVIGFILLVVKILYLIDWAVVLQLTGIEG